ncbi:MAG: 2-amino-4-hydroxy-6-hydroxymethyldihydropteridine diphosphokinase [Gammaproteobacteria bacterium]|nr:2-amino-4-hydroxy-6-hydroxymethyldihydropteridine diphosphokinase [Gammaproteobacteria bacterium]
MSELVYIGLGSNLGNSEQHLLLAFEALEKLSLTLSFKRSSLYRSAPMGPQDQNDYLNAVAEFKCDLPPIELLDQLQSIEQQHDRKRQGERWGPRTLDLDLLLYGNKAIDLPRLKVPHYGLKERNFVLLPLFELAPNLELPDGTGVAQLLENIGQHGIEKIA